MELMKLENICKHKDDKSSEPFVSSRGIDSQPAVQVEKHCLECIQDDKQYEKPHKKLENLKS